MTEVLEQLPLIAPVSIGATALGALVMWFWSRAGRSALLHQQVADAKTHAKEADDRAEAVQKAHDVLLERLHTHMLGDAASFARLEQIATTANSAAVSSEIRLTAALEKLGGRLEAMAARFDEFLQRVTLPQK